MTIEVLIPTMDETDIQNLLKRMNIHTRAIVVNQTDLAPKVWNEEFHAKGAKLHALCFNVNERGVGLSRNTSLSRADSDIVLFADDDLCYNDHYQKLVTDIFEAEENIDIALFNVPGVSDGRPDDLINKAHRVYCFNFMRYGTYRVAARLSSLRKNNIYFSQMFGGGARFGSGEDTLFLAECLQKGLRIKAYPVEIAKITPRQSTWFMGYNEKYFRDKGALFAALSKKFSRILIYRYAISKRKQFGKEVKLKQIVSEMLKGRLDWKTGRFFQ